MYSDLIIYKKNNLLNRSVGFEIIMMDHYFIKLRLTAAYGTHLQMALIKIWSPNHCHGIFFRKSFRWNPLQRTSVLELLWVEVSFDLFIAGWMFQAWGRVKDFITSNKFPRLWQVKESSMFYLFSVSKYKLEGLLSFFKCITLGKCILNAFFSITSYVSIYNYTYMLI